ncbi:hypothetical protein NPX13_g4154 [Xylaria arbuscula]|uniref:G1/S-specific cyclin pas1 n=1 Tax=Xylaria arbuscula TaxID=114810 RepID=A0A9W8NGV5_9PEZI|nr:hypothetical protein NPX13_g4154 [Xylaria arbuscula]
MMYSEHDSLKYTINSSQDGPYNSSLASSASSSATSVFSEPSSLTSEISLLSTSSDSSYQSDSYFQSQQPSFCRVDSLCSQLRTVRPQQVEVAQSLRQNPRRTSNNSVSRNGPPTLARQSDRKLNFVDGLVDSSTQIVEAIWPLASVFHRQEMGHKAVLPLRTFIQETLRRSRTSYSTLQVALYYLILIKPHVPNHDFTMEQPEDVHATRALQCGRRMFLAALILASKYLQDRNYSARAWSKISGLATLEINQNEMAFLSAVNWKLHITEIVFKRWTEVILNKTPSQPPSGSGSQAILEQSLDWKNLILQLEPDLSNVEDLIPSSPSRRILVSLPESPSSSPMTPRVRATPLIEAPDVTPTPKNATSLAIMEPAPSTATTPGRFAPALGPASYATPHTAVDWSLHARCGCCQLDAWWEMLHEFRHGPGCPGVGIADSRQVAKLYQHFPSQLHINAASVPRQFHFFSVLSGINDLGFITHFTLILNLISLLYGERYSLKPAIASVPEDYEENCITSSPESYTGTVGKDLYQMSLNTPIARRDCDLDDAADAARALQELQNYHHSSTRGPLSRTRSGMKRGRRVSTDDSLQENVREMLCEQYSRSSTKEWQHIIVESQSATDYDAHQTPVYNSLDGCRKRLCCSTEALMNPYVIPTIHPAMGGPGGPGMWEGILN